MVRYLIQGRYTNEAVDNLITHPEDRGAVIRDLLDRLGGKVVTFDYSFGHYHFVSIVEVPNNESMEALNLAIHASGANTEFDITVLIPMEEAVRAMARARGSGYQPPHV